MQHEIVFPTESHVLDPTEIRRLSRQCQAIIDRLRVGPATNAELATMALKYTSRISSCREAGYDIRVMSRSGGTVTYRLVSEPPA